jgi:MoaA/NifB/PqqE/SkfB family radical SAM enzyme
MKIQINILRDFITSLRRPLALAIETSSLCNANCVMCPREEYEREENFMNSNTFEKIIYDAKNIGINVFQLSFYGESLLDNKLEEKINFIRNLIPNSWIQIVTNGSLLNKKRTNKLLEANISEIRISIEGNNKVEYEKIRNGLNYDTLVENVKILKEERDRLKSQTQIVITGLHLENNLLNESDYKNFWNKYANKVYVRNEYLLNQKQNESLISKILPCDFLFKYLPILSDGSYPICIYDWLGKTNYGNINSSSIKDAWFAKKILYYKISHLLGFKRKLELCSKCGYRTNYRKLFE